MGWVKDKLKKWFASKEQTHPNKNGSTTSMCASMSASKHYEINEYMCLNLIKEAIDSKDSSELINYLDDNVRYEDNFGNKANDSQSVLMIIDGIIEMGRREKGLDVKAFLFRVCEGPYKGKMGVGISSRDFEGCVWACFIGVKNERINSVKLFKNQYIIEDLEPLPEICKHHKDTNVTIAECHNGLDGAADAARLIKKFKSNDLRFRMQLFVQQNFLVFPASAWMFYLYKFQCRGKNDYASNSLTRKLLERLNSDISLIYVGAFYYRYLEANALVMKSDEKVLKTIMTSRGLFFSLCHQVLPGITKQELADIDNAVRIEGGVGEEGISRKLTKILTKYVLCSCDPNLNFDTMAKCIWPHAMYWFQKYFELAVSRIDHMQKFYQNGGEDYVNEDVLNDIRNTLRKSSKGGEKHAKGQDDALEEEGNNMRNMVDQKEANNQQSLGINDAEELDTQLGDGANSKGEIFW